MCLIQTTLSLGDVHRASFDTFGNLLSPHKNAGDFNDSDINDDEPSAVETQSKSSFSTRSLRFAYGGDETTQSAISGLMQDGKLPAAVFVPGMWHVCLNLHNMILDVFSKFINFQALKLIVGISSWNSKENFKKTHIGLMHAALGFLVAFFSRYRNKTSEEEIRALLSSDATLKIWWNFSHCVLISHLLLMAPLSGSIVMICGLMEYCAGYFNLWSPKKRKYSNLCSPFVKSLEKLSTIELSTLENSGLSIHLSSSCFIENGQIYSYSRPMFADEFNEHLVALAKQFESRTQELQPDTANAAVCLTLLRPLLKNVCSFPWRSSRLKFELNAERVVHIATSFLNPPQIWIPRFLDAVDPLKVRVPSSDDGITTI